MHSRFQVAAGSDLEQFADVDHQRPVDRRRVDPVAVDVRARAIIASLQVQARTLSGDLEALTEGKCPGARCSGASERFASTYKHALSGSIEAMRWLVTCFSSTCDGATTYSGLRACTWSVVILQHLGEAAPPEDKQAQRRLCFAMRPWDLVIIQSEQSAIGDLMSEQASARPSRRHR